MTCLSHELDDARTVVAVPEDVLVSPVLKDRQLVRFWKIGKVEVVIKNPAPNRPRVVGQINHAKHEINRRMCERFITKSGAVENVLPGRKNESPILIRGDFLHEFN